MVCVFGDVGKGFDRNSRYLGPSGKGVCTKYTLDLRSTLSDRPEGGGSVGMTLFQQLEMGNGCSRVDWDRSRRHTRSISYILSYPKFTR